jgi:hypothetical protein
MSCGCDSSYDNYGGVCRQDLPYPSVSHESVPSLIDNLVAALYGGFYNPITGENAGGIVKSVVNGRVVWAPPCNPSNVAYQFPGVPPNPGEGVLCYILRVFSGYQSNQVTVANTVTLYNKSLYTPSLSGSVFCGTFTGLDTLGNSATLPAASLVGGLSIIPSDSSHCPTLGSALYATSAYLINTSISGGSSSNRTLISPTLTGASLSAATINATAITLPAGCVGTSQITNYSILPSDILCGQNGNFNFDTLGNWTLPAAVSIGGGLSANGATFASAVSLGGNLVGNNATFSSAAINGGTIYAATLSSDVLSGNTNAAAATISGGVLSSPTLSGTAIGSAGAKVPSSVIYGTQTNDNVPSTGYVGEYVSSQVTTGVSLATSGTTYNVTSISLPAGDWNVYGNVNLIYASATVAATGAQSGGISTTSATFGGQDTYFVSSLNFNNSSLTNSSPVPIIRISVASTTTVYLVAKATFTAGSVSATGILQARRVR